MAISPPLATGIGFIIMGDIKTASIEFALVAIIAIVLYLVNGALIRQSTKKGDKDDERK